MIRRALGLAALLLISCAASARAEPAMWVVRDADSTIVLFGSFHLLPAGVAWRPKALDLALSQADDLWFEIPMGGPVNGAAQTELLARGTLPPDETLSAMLSAKAAKRLAEVCAEVGVPLAAIDRLQPWYAETALGMAVYRRQGALPEEGVEQQIAQSAPPQAERRALESAAEQIDMIAAGSRAEQIASLEHSLALFDDDPAFFKRLMTLWLKGDVRGLDREVVGDLRKTAPAQYQSLIVARNKAWVPKLMARLHGSGHTVVVVGVGHLVGPDGLPNLLRAAGAQVTGP